jgi:DNA-binding PadR family transcriptional regulator
MLNPFRNLHKEFHERIEEMQRFGGLRIWILHVIEEHGPANGVEIMDAIQRHQESLELMAWNRRGGHRPPRPSPGSIYPMLKKMIDEGLISKKEDGKYTLTEKGEKVIYKLSGRLRHLRDMDRATISINNALTEIDGYVSYLEDIKKSKLVPQKEIIGELSERLKKLEKSLPEE